MTRLAFAVLAFLSLAAAFTGGVWWFAYSSALDQLADRGRSDLSLASDRLVSQMQQYRELAVLMADHPTLSGALRGEVAAPVATALLLRTADKTGTLQIHLARADGTVVASSDGSAGRSLAAQPDFRRAMNGALGTHHSRIRVDDRRIYTFAAPVFADSVRPLGVVSVDVNVSALEGAWAGDPEAIYFTDAQGVVFLSNRSELLFRKSTRADPAALARFGYAPGSLQPMPSRQKTTRAGHELWSIDGGPYLPSGALHLTRPLPVVGMTGELLLDVAPAERIAGLQAAVAGALALIFGGTLLLLLQRRRALSERLALEAAANARLESRVAARTAELSRANRN
ncbi:MAG: sensor histidine kinase, partial [Paracoccaceae bacterium]